MAPGERLDYHFQSERPVNFNIHYHEGEIVTYPVKQDQVATSTGSFVAEIKQHYCMMWRNVEQQPTAITYEFRLGKR